MPLILRTPVYEPRGPVLPLCGLTDTILLGGVREDRVRRGPVGLRLDHFSLHYGETNGAPDATDAVGQIAKALQPKNKANALKGQADFIAQQQRLIGCQVSPATCK